MRVPRTLGSLYICYLSLADPLVHTQVVAYLSGLAAAGHRIHLLTFETSRLTSARRRQWRTLMAEQDIAWYGLRYHKTPSLPATAWDVLCGAVIVSAIVRRHRLDVLHARAHVPAAMALISSNLLRRRPPALIFDIRGLMAEEYEDAGRWRRASIAFRLTKAVEGAAIRRAVGIVVLTARVCEQLFGPRAPREVHVIPCCADTSALATAGTRRLVVRERLGLSGARVMVYVGKFGGWYMAEEMAAFFAVARELMPGLHFLILTQEDAEPIRRALRRHGIPREQATIDCVSPSEVGGYLAAADFGISFIQPAPSKASSSPTKIGEYLGAGLPVLATAGVGDLDRLLSGDVGVLVREHTREAHVAAAREILRLVSDASTSERCRAVAQGELSLDDIGIPRYRHLYEQVAETLNDSAVTPRRAVAAG